MQSFYLSNFHSCIYLYIVDIQAAGVAGCIAVFEGIVLVRGSEVFQNIPGKEPLYIHSTPWGSRHLIGGGSIF